MASAPYSPANPDAYVGLGKQAAKGTGVVPANFAAFVSNVELNPAAAMRIVREGGSGPYIARHTKDIYLPGVRFATPARPILAGALLAWLLGEDTVTGAADPYTHTIVPDGGTVWVSFERNVDDDIIDRITDGVILEVTIDLRKRDQGAEILMTALGTGLSVEPVASPTAESYEAGRPFLRSDATWTVDNSAEAAVESATLTLRWRYDEAITADAVTRYHLTKLLFEADLQLTELWWGSGDKDAYVATHYGTSAGTGPSPTVYGTTTKAFEVSLDYNDTGPKARQLKITIPAIDWIDAKVTEPDPEASQAGKLTRVGRAVKPPSGSIVTAVVQNGRSTGYT